MTKQICFLLFVLLSMQGYAQTGIGTSTPDPSAKLEVNSSNKGFLPPRIALTALNSAGPVTNPATGLLIFNTATAGIIPNQVTPGYYYWDGVNLKWVRLEDKADNLGNHTATENIRLNGYYLSNDGGNEGIRVDNSGNVGIGTTSPAAKLHLSNSGAAGLELSPTAGALGGTYIQAYNRSTSDFAPLDIYASQIAVWANNAERMRITSGGNVGIGTNNPTAKLNIAGGGVKIASGLGNASTRPSVNTSTIGNYEIRGVGGGASQIDGQDDGFLRLSAGGGTNAFQQSSIDLSGYSASVPDMNNTIVMRTAGDERLRIDNSGNVNVTGKLNVGDPTSNVVTKVSGIVNLGSYLALDNLKATVPNVDRKSLSIAAVATTFTANVSGMYGYSAGGYGYSDLNQTITTTTSSKVFDWHFPREGDGAQYLIYDKTNTRMYRVSTMTGVNANSFFISIERLH